MHITVTIVLAHGCGILLQQGCLLAFVAGALHTSRNARLLLQPYFAGRVLVVPGVSAAQTCTDCLQDL